MNSNISFVIFAFNEERRIGHIIRNFRDYGEVLVLDDGSTDRTKEICDELGAKYLLRPKTGISITENDQMYNFVASNAVGEWIYWGYADDLAPKKLLEKMTGISKQDKIKYVEIPLYTYLWGKTKHVAHKGYSPMFFKKGYVDFKDNKIHSMGKFVGRQDERLKLPNRDEYAIGHYSVYDLNKFVLNHLRYAEEEAKANFQSGKKFSGFRMIAAMARYFFMFYKNSYKNGISGFIAAFSYVVFRFVTHARLYELENNLTLENIEAEYAKSKEELLKEFN